MESLFQMVQLAASVFVALMAGLFYAYSCSVNPGLSKLADTEYLAAMQSINRAILNIWFFIPFMGTLILIPACTWLCYQDKGTAPAFYMMLASGVIYIVGVFGATITGNVPLNNMLDKANLQAATAAQIKQLRRDFETRWNKFHTVRTICNIIALFLLLTSIINR